MKLLPLLAIFALLVGCGPRMNAATVRAEALASSAPVPGLEALLREGK
jgi:hypothetical protein